MVTAMRIVCYVEERTDNDSNKKFAVAYGIDYVQPLSDAMKQRISNLELPFTFRPWPSNIYFQPKKKSGKKLEELYKAAAKDIAGFVKALQEDGSKHLNLFLASREEPDEFLLSLGPEGTEERHYRAMGTDEIRNISEEVKKALKGE